MSTTTAGIFVIAVITAQNAASIICSNSIVLNSSYPYYPSPSTTVASLLALQATPNSGQQLWFASCAQSPTSRLQSRPARAKPCAICGTTGTVALLLQLLLLCVLLVSPFILFSLVSRSRRRRRRGVYYGKTARAHELHVGPTPQHRQLNLKT